MNFLRLILAALWVCGAGIAPAAVTNDAARAEVEGRELVQRLRELWPAASFTNSATLRIRAGRERRADVPLEIITRVTDTNWSVSYRADTTNAVAAFTVIHGEQANEYRSGACPAARAGVGLTQPLAGSDFWLLDLGTEFFHWPGQMLWKKEIKKGQSCDVLESRPADPDEAGYARIVSWIDRDTGGIVQAEAYDPRGKRLKDFEVKEFSKVKGEWRVTEIEMRNVQTKSRTLLVFDYTR